MSDPHLLDPRLDGYDRGFPPAAAGLQASEVGDRGWTLHGHFDTPIATIRGDHLTHNAALMRDWCAGRDAELWPHAKTVMSPQLISLQRESGAQGFTAATFAQARLLLDWDVPGVLIANQIVQPRAAEWLTRKVAASGQELLCYVDGIHGIQVLEAAARTSGTALPVLLELGAPQARTGIRSGAEVEGLRRELDRSPHLRLVGVAGYEGSFGADRSRESLLRVDAFLERQVELLAELVAAGAINCDRPLFSAGGSMYFDRVESARRKLPVEHRLLLRSGCYLLHDTGLFENATPLQEGPGAPGLRAALTVWGTVHSRPEATRAYLDIGRRDVGNDQGLPRPLRRLPLGEGHAEAFDQATVVQLNDQHLHLELSADSPVGVGDRIEFGISHPCTTMDKWRALAVVEEDGAVTGAVSTRF